MISVIGNISAFVSLLISIFNIQSSIFNLQSNRVRINIRYFLFAASAFFVLFLSFSSCKKENFETGQVTLKFSEDTIMFDTVFTTVGSATEVFTVYNPGDNDVLVNSIRLATGESSNFRLNVDGVPGKSFTNVEIPAHDSIWVFVEVTIDPNNVNTPLIVTDSILFVTNGFAQDLDLVAWGQDAYFHRPPQHSPIYPFFQLSCNEVWNNDKPHVIYGYALVDSGCTLTVNAGTNVYLHPGSGIIVCNSATLLVNGTLQDKVRFQGDRLGEDFKDVPGQWDRIWLSNLNLHSNIISPGSRNSVIKHAIIKNGFIGLLVDTVYDANPNTLTLQLENTIIKNMASHAVALRGSRVNAYNCVFANCGAQTANILYGGTYNFYHCTFANFWNNSNRQDPAVTLNNYTNAPRPLNAFFANSIIYGNNDNELGLDSFPTGNMFGFKFDHVLLKVESVFPTGDATRYNAILKAFGGNYDPFFADIDNNFYQLDSLNSPAINAGDSNLDLVSPLLSSDILGTDRGPLSPPDLGAYERR